MVGGVLYFNTPLSQGVAVDAQTGETLWVFNPKSYEEGSPPMSSPWTQRGVAYWTDGDKDDRIFWGTGNGYMVCVDAKTGRPCADFGANGSGMVDTMVGVPRANREDRDYLNAMLWGIHSPPLVVRDKVIHGSHVADRRSRKKRCPAGFAPGTSAPANTPGTSTPCRMAPTNSGLTPGSTSPGATPETPRLVDARR